jgi:small-conductance mechanosensitive channel
VPDVLRNAEGSFVAQYLVRIINQVGHRTLQSVPNSGVSREPFVLFELPAGRIAIEPLGTGADTRWKFTADTARTIRGLYRAAEQLPDNNALDPTFIPFSPMFALRALVKQHVPFLLNTLLGQGHIEYWQALASLLVLCAIALSTILLRGGLLWILKRPYLMRHVKNAKGLATGLALGVSFLVGSRFIVMIGLPAATRQYTVPVVGTILILIFAYALWQLVIFVLSVLQELAEKTETAFDNIVLTFTAGLAKLAIVVGAVMALSYLWSLPTTGLLAGLGISGLAVAFASKETIANVFGAGILLGDRPFRKGDRIIAGDVNGWVEAVGLRSTRIRTLYDSLLVVPNAKLADTVVNNLGARRRRSLSATVIVTSGATPERMEAFTRAIRQRIADDPIFEDKWAEVNIVRFWTEGIDVEISTMVETRSGRASREATHKLYLDIMQIAEANGLGLAHATAPHGGAAAAQ